MEQEDNWVAVGTIGKPHGLGGLLTIRPFTRPAEEFMEAPLTRVFTRRQGRMVGELTFVTLTMHSGTPLARFEGVSDRNAAEALVGLEMVIPEGERWELEEGSYYADDLVGLRLVAEDGKEFGEVLEVREGPAHDYLVFAHPRKAKAEALLPLVDAFVLKIDEDGARIVVRIPDGLFDT